MSQKTHIIIGTSAAGIAAATKVRELDAHARIICISHEPEMPYNKCLLADYLAGHRNEQAVFTKNSAFFAAHDIIPLLGIAVKKIDPANKIVELADEKKIEYDSLFLGTGSSARTLAISGATHAGVYTYQTLADTQHILQYLQQRAVKNVVILGAGLSGLECADALRQKGLQVTIVEKSCHLLPHILDTAGSNFLAQHLEKNGMRVLVGQEAISIAKTDSALIVALKNGSNLYTELLISAIGCIPNSFLAADAGVALKNNFVITDVYLRTSDSAIFAGGDVALVPNFLTGESTITNRWSDAVVQGATAAYGMVGQPQPYAGIIPRSNTTVAGLQMCAAGVSMATIDPALITHTIQADYCRAIYQQNGILTGFYLMGTNVKEEAGRLRRALMNKEQVSFE